MGFSRDELRTVGDWSSHACSVRSEGNSQNSLRFRTMAVMRVPSDLYSLLRNGGWIRNSFASVPCAALGLLLNRCLRVGEQSVSAEASSVEVIGKKATSTGWESGTGDLREHIVPGSFKVCWFWKRQQSVPPETIAVGVGNSKKTATTTWDSLPADNVQENVDFKDLFHLKTSSDSWKKFIEGEAFRQSRGGISAGVFETVNNYIKNKSSWRCSGLDLHSKSWGSLPPVSYLPPPDAELFKEYSARGHGGLMCAEVSKLPNKGELEVFNPLTGETRALPPLLHPRNPVLVHLSVDSAKKSYNGSSAASDDHISKKVEVFDSSASKWTEVYDLPGPVFGLNEHQAGVCLNGKLFFISFLESGGGRGVLAFDVENGTWLQDLTTPIPWSSSSKTLQLVESDGEIFVLSDEQEPDHSVDHCIDELEFQNPKAGVLTCRWRSFVKVKGIFNPLPMKVLNILLASCIAILPNGVCAGDPSMDSRSGVWKVSNSNAFDSPDFAKKAAVTLLVGLTLIGGKFAWGFFRRRLRAPDHRFHIMQGLEDTDTPTTGDPLFAIPPTCIPASRG